MIGWQELLIVFFIVLLLFGAKRLPEIARSMGNAVNEFKKTKDDIMNENHYVSTPSHPAPKADDAKDEEKS